jgi:hypothetical protein
MLLEINISYIILLLDFQKYRHEFQLSNQPHAVIDTKYYA